MKRLWLLVVLYCIVHKASGDFAVTYEGMDKNTVKGLIKQTYKAKFDFVDKPTYDSFQSAHLPKDTRIHQTGAVKNLTPG